MERKLLSCSALLALAAPAASLATMAAITRAPTISAPVLHHVLPRVASSTMIIEGLDPTTIDAASTLISNKGLNAASTLISNEGIDAATTLLGRGEAFLQRMPITGWTIVTTLMVLAIGQAFEIITHNAKHAVPKTLLPVLEVILAEVTTIGFTGLMVNALHASSTDSALGRFSEHYLGDASELFELFETADSALFPATVAFLSVCGVTISVVNTQFKSYKASTQKELLEAKLASDLEREACTSGADASTACLLARKRRNHLRGVLLESMHQPGIDGERVSAADSLLELVKAPEARRAEFLRFRARFIEQGAEQGRPLPDDFHFGKYLQYAAAENLRGLVAVEPVQLVLVWLPLILIETVALTMGGGVDGDFLPQLICLAQPFIGVWALWNHVRLHSIKTLLTPQLGVMSESISGEPSERVYKLLPPRYSLLGGSLRRPTWLDRLAVIERMNGAPANGGHDQLFGALGSNGPAFHLSSMKLVLFSSIVSLAYFGGGGGDAFAASAAASAAECLSSATPDAACELIASIKLVLGQLAVLPSVMAIALTPFTFINYNFATCVEGRRRQDIADAVLREQREERFQNTLASLGSLCAWIESAVHASDDATAARALPRRTQQEVDEAWTALLSSHAPERLLDVRALFEAADNDGSGTIGIEEVASIVQQLGYTPTAAGLRALFLRMDVDGSDEVSFIEFCTAVLDAPASAAPAAAARPNGAGASAMVGAAAAMVGGDGGGTAGAVIIHPSSNILPLELGGRVFEFFDTDGSGAIDEAEMLEKLQGLGFDLRGVSQLFTDIAGAEKGAVSRSDFMLYLKQANEKAAAKAAA